jgi:hypothetical protein
MSSESKAQQGIQQTVKHFKAFFISEKPIFLSKILIFICLARYIFQGKDFTVTV